ncbi:MAG: hypothetical protein LBD06_05805 [Candidatus Accumulibacter sp.]|nr:hypothetical protein [Accumulibacter sp.]
MRRFAPFRGQKTERSGSEDRAWRGQKTGQFAALRAVQRTELGGDRRQVSLWRFALGEGGETEFWVSLSSLFSERPSTIT